MNETIDNLLKRSSMKMVTAPGPNEQELEQILQAAMSAPDHGSLIPWRFKVIQGDAIKTFTELALKIRQEETPVPEEKVAVTRQWLSEVPLILVVACHIDYSNTKIKESERMIAAGCAVMQILNACYALGYGAFWASGLSTDIDRFQTAIGFDALDYRNLGYITIGTPKIPIPVKKRDSYETIAQSWTGPLDE